MLLKKKGVEYADMLVSRDDDLREKMERMSGRRTVPQIFIDGQSIGGFEELYALEQSGELDSLLAAPAEAGQIRIDNNQT